MSAFTWRALVELILVGAVCGVLGVHIVLRRLAYTADMLSHVMLPGAVVATLAGADLRLGAAAAVAAAGGATVRRATHGKTSQATITGVIVSGSLAVGAVLASASDGFRVDLAAALVGSPLTVTASDITVFAAIGLVVLVTLAVLAKELTFAAFDPVGLRALGCPARWLDALVLILLGAVVVAAVPAVGSMLPLALLAGPAGAALLWARRLVPAMVLAALLGAAAGAGGLALSLTYRLATGATVALVCGLIFLVACGFAAARRAG
ncbi:metal ABC transporter permease [Nonomuraea aridisoli]|uniref:metal ABC transporter permease n=1 Tax=Nonomuraea aridisoli TaxID=2070368 RepID=UPI0015E88DC9|nr:metal ABC transporter permease [Nonomuraea aridisoli]